MADGFLDQWLICGPFYSDRGWTTLDEDYLFGEAQVRPGHGSRSFGREWLAFDTDGGFLQFLNAPFAHTLFCTAYAHTYVFSPRDTDALLLTGSDDGIKAWLNGDVAWRNDVNRSAVPGEDRAPVHLREGWNSLLVKVRQGMNHWQFCAQLVRVDGSAVPGLECAREAESTGPPLSARAVGVRVRFAAETYEFTHGPAREVCFEVGCIGAQACQDVAIDVDGAEGVVVGTIARGETQIADSRLPFGSALEVMRGNVRASACGAPVEATVVLSESSRLLRDLFAPFFVPAGANAEPPEPLRGFGWSELTTDGKGRYMLVDPPGLRRYLAHLVGKFPMEDEQAAAARKTCDDLLRLALGGKHEEFARVLGAEVRA